MLKLRKYYYQYWYAFIVILGLLFLQANTELALPDYMSNIVSTGIQAGGFKTSVSEVLTEDTYKHLLLFVPDKKQATVRSAYKLVKYADLNQKYKKEFKKLNKQNLYILKNISNKKYKQLEQILIKPSLIVLTIDRMDRNSQAYQQAFGNLPANVSPYQVIAQLTAEQKDKMFASIDKRIAGMGDSTVLIAAGNAVKAEYQRLGADLDRIQRTYILQQGLLMLGISLIGGLASILVTLLASRVGAKLARGLRQDVFEKVESFSATEFNKFSTASLITRTTNDITQVQNTMMMLLRIVLYAPIMGVGALIKVLESSASLLWITAVVLLILIGVMILVFAIAMPKFKLVQKLIDKLNLKMRESLNGMLVIRAFGNEKASEKRFDQANQELTDVNLFTNRVMVTIVPIMMFILNVTSLAIIWFGSKQVDLGALDIGKMMAFLQYSMQMIMAFLMIAMVAVIIPRASVAAGRIAEVLNMELAIKDPTVSKDFDETKKGLLEFENVSFAYPGAQEPVLSDINILAQPGTTTAIIGSTGSGKTTLISLINRFYDVTAGSLTLAGIDVRETRQSALRQRIGYVPQKGVLFSGTIRSNIIYGNENLSDEKIREYLEIAQAAEFVDKLEEGLDTVIAQGGTNVSGGQRQRLAIARALAKESDLLIFDDSFSALDFKTDARLRAELKKLINRTKQTVLIIGQRIASIRDADQIVVLDQGRVVGLGSHDELMKTCQVYQEIANSQLSKEEIANG